MSSDTSQVNHEREAYIQNKMDEFAKMEAKLEGRKIEFLNNVRKDSNCKCHLLITAAAIVLFIAACLTVAVLASLGLII